ncbi:MULTISPECIES: alpha,alpha-phosphotrehalase [Megamonas]|jgi:trehalose-6-phosphate hydrolase|uniref:Alpha,alpha-phosphotrehalase n=1 Tax=Megamonas rupellensis TaxID=491921 RepID=A0A411ZRE4_9FIRM|nr:MULTISPECIES: alpha,alpha-phosphotrehalase [Megamonas]RGO04034.1 alpha,alpha-phosphotrehalase [Megamonas rupellensis]RGQ05340.1 alpha,alpha-phosphotrehalase [Megamonas rupellensis]
MNDFKKKVVYQIYPKSFKDTNGTGTGDLKGVIEKLDYLQALGVDYIWLTPFYVSPQNDNGYDVADYYNIDPSYGTMEDVENLIAEAKKRNIYLMMDMVFNHVSTEHIWFKKAMAGEEKYLNYFFFKQGKANNQPPTNWNSKFGGPAWEYVEKFDKWYLHLFDKTQADLNWENPEVREEVKNIVRFWMEKGVKGFRFDVINLISKAGFEDDFSVDGDGRSFYTDGPRIHEFLQELARDSFAKDKDIITVGEMSSTTMENCYKYAGEKTGELSMVFTFHHLKVDFMGNEKWVLVPTDFMKLKQLIFDWQINMEKNNAWNAVFWCNHDQPRVISRFGSDDKYHKESGKMLATLIHCLRGTPYIYQGEEIGMTNPHFKSIEQYRDVESLNHYQILQDKGMTKEQALMILDVHSRDNSRTPMQWDDSINAGFTTGTPWIQTADNYTEINVKNSLEDKDSIFYYYQKLIQLRKNYDVIAYGDIKPLLREDKRVFVYERNYKGQKLIVICNFYPTTYEIELPYDLSNYKCILNNYKNEAKAKKIALKPYETLVYCNL